MSALEQSHATISIADTATFLTHSAADDQFSTPTHGADAAESEAAHPPVHAPSSGQLALQRLFDLSLATVALVVFVLAALCLAVVVKATSKGPVFFKQQRVGRNGELFNVVKFRTMRDGTHREVLDNEAERQAYRDNDFKLRPDDPRITSVGRVMRKTSLDELPQLFNVLAGDMSIVGIRPLLDEELELRPRYDQELYRSMRPGLTGLWQVEGRSTVQKDDRLHLDRRHLENWSVWGDVKLAARTPLALLRTGHAH